MAWKTTGIMEPSVTATVILMNPEKDAEILKEMESVILPMKSQVVQTSTDIH